PTKDTQTLSNDLFMAMTTTTSPIVNLSDPTMDRTSTAMPVKPPAKQQPSEFSGRSEPRSLSMDYTNATVGTHAGTNASQNNTRHAGYSQDRVGRYSTEQYDTHHHQSATSSQPSGSHYTHGHTGGNSTNDPHASGHSGYGHAQTSAHHHHHHQGHVHHGHHGTHTQEHSSYPL
ncbi:hypothetical protein BGW38_009193, partial [Lunasporangiospora selenospora]